MSDITIPRRDRLDNIKSDKTLPKFSFTGDILKLKEESLKIYSSKKYDTFVIGTSPCGSSVSFASEWDWKRGTFTGTCTVSGSTLVGGASGGTWTSPIIYWSNSSNRNTIDNFNHDKFNGTWTEESTLTSSSVSVSIVDDSTWVAQGDAYLRVTTSSSNDNIYYVKNFDENQTLQDNVHVIHKGNAKIEFYSGDETPAGLMKDTGKADWDTGMSDWPYRTVFSVTEQTGSDQTDLQFKITFNSERLVSAGRMNSDGSDIRFFDEDGNQLSYWIENGVVEDTSSNAWAYYKLDEGTGTTAADELGSNNASITNGTWKLSDKGGYCLDFTGGTTSGYIDTSAYTQTTDFVVAGWFKPNDVGGTNYNILFGNMNWGTNADGNWHLRFDVGSPGKLRLIWWSNGGVLDNFYSSKSDFTVGTWYHIAVVKSGSSIRLYINGELDTEDTVNGSWGTGSSGSKFYIGGAYNASNYWYNGELDEIRIYSDDLTAEAIRYLYGRTTDVWVKASFTAGETKTIKMYYGNSEASSASSGSNVFEFFDDFDGTSLSSDWSSSGTPTVSGGVVSLNDNDIILANNTTGWGPGHIFEAKSKADEQDTKFIQVGDSVALDPNNMFDIINADAISDNNFDLMTISTRSGGGSISRQNIDDVGDFRNTYYVYGIHWISSSSVKYYQGDTYLGEHTSNIPTIDLYPGAAVYDSSQESQLDIDWIRVRKYVSSEPTVTEVQEDSYYWHLHDYDYRKPIVLKENSSTTLTDYQVKLTIDTQTLISAGKMRADANDLRFILNGYWKSTINSVSALTDYQVGIPFSFAKKGMRFYVSTSPTFSDQLPYWVEDGKIWVKTNLSVGDNFIYFRPHNDAPAPSGSSVFIEFYDFNDGTTQGWTLSGTGGTLTNDGNALKLTDNTQSSPSPVAERTLKNNFTTDFIVDYKVKINNVSGTSTILMYLGVSSSQPYGALLGRYGGNWAYFTTAWQDLGLAFKKNTWYNVTRKVFLSSDQENISVDGIDLGTYAMREYGGEVNSIQHINFFFNTLDRGDIFYDNVRFRQYTATEPTVSTVFQDSSTYFTELPFWIESGINTSSTVIWVKVPSIMADCLETIYMYYGNSSASSASDGSSTFLAFDHFEGSSLGSEWSPYGTVSVSNSKVSISEYASCIQYTDFDMTEGMSIVVRAISDEQDVIFIALGTGTDIVANIGFTETGIGVHNSDESPQDGNFTYLRLGSYVTACEQGDYSTTTDIRNWVSYEVQRINGEINFLTDGSLVHTRTTQVPTDPLRFYSQTYGQLSTIQIDYYFIRKIASSEPTASERTEESSTCSEQPYDPGTLEFSCQLSNNPTDWTESSFDSSLKKGTEVRRVVIQNSGTDYYSSDSNYHRFALDALWFENSSRSTTWESVVLTTSNSITTEILDASDDSVLYSSTENNINLSTLSVLEGKNIKVRHTLGAGETITSTVVSWKADLCGDNRGIKTLEVDM